MKSVERYINLCKLGDSTINERYKIILETKKNAITKMENLKQQLKMLDYKENYYKTLIENNLKDKYNPINK